MVRKESKEEEKKAVMSRRTSEAKVYDPSQVAAINIFHFDIELPRT